MKSRSDDQQKERLQGPERAIVPVLVERVLLEYSDMEHRLSVSQIRKHLEEDYGIECAPKGKLIQNSLDGLAGKYNGHEVMDLALDKGTGRNSKWWANLESRKFDREEVAYLISLCYSSHAGQNRQLVEKLESLLSRTEREGITDPYEKPVAGQRKSLAETLYGLSVAQEAIDFDAALFAEDDEGEMPSRENGRTVSFRYYASAEAEASFTDYPGLFPLQARLVDGYYYLACARPGKKNKHTMRKGVIFFRLDLIEDLRVETLEGEFPEGYEERRRLAAEFIASGVDRMFPDNEAKISRVVIKIRGEEKRIRQAKRYVEARFASSKGFTTLNPDADGFPKYRFNVGVDGFKLWVLKWLDCIEVLEPASLREDILELIQSNVYGNFAEETGADD